MPSTATNQLLKIQSIIEGKAIAESVSKVNDLLNQALMHDGILGLAQDLMSAAAAEENRKQVLDQRFQPSSNTGTKRKFISEQKLQRLEGSDPACDESCYTCSNSRTTKYSSSGAPKSCSLFAASKEWYLNAQAAIVSIQTKDLVSAVIYDLEDITARASLFARRIHARIPSFVTPRVLANRTDLHSGKQFHWDSLSRHLEKISTLLVLSGHVADDLKLRGSRESYISSNKDTFLEVMPDSMKATLVRSGISEQVFGDRFKTHKADSLLRKPLAQQRRLYKWYPDKSIAEQ
eukprot:jgi/Psemu1/2317/gm1.2317_g